VSDGSARASAPDEAPESAPTARSEGSAWLVSPRFDLGVFVAPALGSLLLACFGSRLADTDGRTPTWAWLLFVVGIDVAHVHGTTLRVYLTARELLRRPALYLGVPALALLVSSVAYAHAPQLFWRLLAYLAVFHFIRQQVGWARLYRKRAHERSLLDARLDEATLYVSMLYPLLVWHARLPTDFEWFVPGDFVQWSDVLRDLAPASRWRALPQQLASTASILWAGLLGSFCLRQLQLRHRGIPFRTGKLLLVATTASTWFCGIVLFANDFAFTVTNVVAHGVPYMAMSYRVTRSAPFTWGPLARSSLIYVCALLSLALAEEWLWDASVWHEHTAIFPAFRGLSAHALEQILVPLLALPQIVHYILDAYLWRLDGSNPGLKHTLLVDRVDVGAGVGRSLVSRSSSS